MKTLAPAIDVVVDANVWAHSANPQNRYFEASVLLCEATPAASYVLCVDVGWSMDDTNRSRIGAEYRKYVRFGTPGYEAIVWLATHERVRFIDPTISNADRVAVNRSLPRNNHDRHYLRLSICTADRVLCSHDFDDFTSEVRAACRRRWGLAIVDAKDLASAIVPQESAQ